MSQGIGRPVIGLVSDRFGRINVAGLGTIIAGLATFLLWILAAKHFAGLIVFALFGAFAGVLWPTVAPVGAEVVGMQLLPSALSIFWIILVIPATFAEPIALTIKGSGLNAYLPVQLFTGFMYVAAFISSKSLQMPPSIYPLRLTNRSQSGSSACGKYGSLRPWPYRKKSKTTLCATTMLSR